MKVKLLFLVALCILSSCGSDDPHYEKSSYYITNYLYDIDGAGVHMADYAPKTLSITLSGKVVNRYGLGDSFDIHKSFSEKFKDTSFNKSSIKMFIEPVIADTITQINIFCKQAFDSDHPANSNINDIVQLRYTSVKSYIESHYSNSKGYEIIQEPLNTFNKKTENILFSAYMSIVLDNLPEESGDYDFTIEAFCKDQILFSVEYQKTFTIN
jgi:hypothetical protein